MQSLEQEQDDDDDDDDDDEEEEEEEKEEKEEDCANVGGRQKRVTRTAWQLQRYWFESACRLPLFKPPGSAF